MYCAPNAYVFAVIGFLFSLDKNKDMHSLPNLFCLKSVRMIPVLGNGRVCKLSILRDGTA